MLRTFSRVSGPARHITPISPVHILMKHTLARDDLQSAVRWYKDFNDQKIRRKYGQFTSSGKRVHLRYPLADLLTQLPVLFHEETKKLKQIENKEIRVTCQKHSTPKENEEESWRVIVTLIDMIASRSLPSPSTQHRRLKVKDRIQQLLALEQEAEQKAYAALTPEGKERVQLEKLQRATNAALAMAQKKRQKNPKGNTKNPY